MSIPFFSEESKWILEDLRRSGLADETISEMQIEEVPKGSAGIEKLKTLLGFASWDGGNIPHLTQSYIIPYLAKGFFRVKLRNKLGDAKYLSPNKQTHEWFHLYFLPSEKEHIVSSKYSLIITEGEKKTAKLTQELRALQPEIKATAVGIAGVTVWRAAVEWKYILPSLSGRDVFICFDSDFRENPAVAFELLKVWLWLWSKKANPKILLWSGEKGIDDFLVAKEKESKKSTDVLKSLLSEAQETIFDALEANEHKLADAVALTLTYIDAQALWETFKLKKKYSLSFTAFKRLVQQRKAQEKDKIKSKVEAEGAFIEKGFSTYKLYVDETKSSVGEEKVANFTMRFLGTMKDDDGKVSWECSLSQLSNIERFELCGADLLVLTSFREKIASRGAFLYNICSQKEHNEFVEFVLSQSKELKHKRKTEYLGRIDKDAFLFNDAIVTPEGIKPLDTLIPPRGRLHLKDGTDRLEGTIGALEYAVDLTTNLYAEQAWKIWGFALGSLFVEEISDCYGCFPLLFLYGVPQSGKDTAALFILSYFGAHIELKPFNFNATCKALHRAGAKYKGIPIVLNEFQSGKNTNALLNSFWDRQGYQRAKTDNTLDLQKAEINATFIVLSTQNVTGNEAEAVLSRVVQVSLDEAKRDVRSVQEMHRIESKLGYFVVHCLHKINPETLLKQIQETIEENRKHISGVSERILKNYSIIQACANAFYISLGYDYAERLGVNAGQIRQDIMEQQEETIAANVAKTFVNVVISMVRKGELPASIARIVKDANKAETLAFSLSDILPLVKRFAKQADIAVVDEKTLAKNLKAIGAENTREYWEESRKRVWKITIVEKEN
jgi:hypothetical protein